MPKTKSASTATPTLDHLISVADIQRRFGRCRLTIIRWIDRGQLKLPDLTIGNEHYWIKENLETWPRNCARCELPPRSFKNHARTRAAQGEQSQNSR